MRCQPLNRLEQCFVKRHQGYFPRLILEEVPHRVMKAKGALTEMEGQQERQAFEPDEQIFRVCHVETAGVRPEPRGDANRHIHILGEDGQLRKAGALGFAQEIEADADGYGNGIRAARVVVGVEGGKALAGEPMA